MGLIELHDSGSSVRARRDRIRYNRRPCHTLTPKGILEMNVTVGQTRQDGEVVLAGEAWCDTDC